jgi:hypothetical protein
MCLVDNFLYWFLYQACVSNAVKLSNLFISISYNKIFIIINTITCNCNIYNYCQIKGARNA